MQWDDDKCSGVPSDVCIFKQSAIQSKKILDLCQNMAISCRQNTIQVQFGELKFTLSSSRGRSLGYGFLLNPDAERVYMRIRNILVELAINQWIGQPCFAKEKMERGEVDDPDKLHGEQMNNRAGFYYGLRPNKDEEREKEKSY